MSTCDIFKATSDFKFHTHLNANILLLISKFYLVNKLKYQSEERYTLIFVNEFVFVYLVIIYSSQILVDCWNLIIWSPSKNRQRSVSFSQNCHTACLIIRLAALLLFAGHCFPCSETTNMYFLTLYLCIRVDKRTINIIYSNVIDKNHKSLAGENVGSGFYSETV